jgi:hypothetical protein
MDDVERKESVDDGSRELLLSHHRLPIVDVVSRVTFEAIS